MRNTLLTAVAAAALMAGPALAQDPPTDPAMPPPSTDRIGEPTTMEPPAPTPEASEPTEPTPPDASQPTTQADPAPPVQTAETDGDDIVDVLRAEGRFTRLVAALEAAGLTGTLESDDAISILAPTDEAFAAMPAGELDRLMAPENREELRELLLYHVLNADVRRDQIENRRGPVVTGSGAQILLDGGGGALRADAATITNADLRGANGAVLEIDQVLDPDTSLAAQGDAEETMDDAAETESEEAATDQPAVEQPAAEQAATEQPEASDGDPVSTAPPPTGEPMPSTPPVNPPPAEDPHEDDDPTTPER